MKKSLLLFAVLFANITMHCNQDELKQCQERKQEILKKIGEINEQMRKKGELILQLKGQMMERIKLYREEMKIRLSNANDNDAIVNQKIEEHMINMQNLFKEIQFNNFKDLSDFFKNLFQKEFNSIHIFTFNFIIENVLLSYQIEQIEKYYEEMEKIEKRINELNKK